MLKSTSVDGELINENIKIQGSIKVLETVKSKIFLNKSNKFIKRYLLLNDETLIIFDNEKKEHKIVEYKIDSSSNF